MTRPICSLVFSGRPVRAAAVCFALFACGGPAPLEPAPGVPQYQEAGFVRLVGGRVNAAGGNLSIARSDLSLDTPLGRYEIGAVWDASGARWHFGFDIRFDGATFVDPTAAVHDTSSLAAGDPIPGSVYAVGASQTIQTRGGLAYVFDGQGRLLSVGWSSLAHPRIEYAWGAAQLDISQCMGPGVCLPLFAVSLDAAGHPTSALDLRTGRNALYDWQGGRLVSARDAGDVAEGLPGEAYEYDFRGRLVARTRSDGERLEYAYDAAGRVREIVQKGEGDPVDRFAYYPPDEAGRYATLHTNAVGARTHYFYDAERRLLEVLRLETGERWTARARRPRRTRLAAPSGATTEMWWVDDTLVSTLLPSGNLVTSSYEPGGLNFSDPLAPAPKRRDDALGPVEERIYDALGRVVEVRNGEGEATVFTWQDATLTSVTSAAGVTRSYSLYGVHGHWLESEAAELEVRSFDAAGDPIVTGAGLQQGGVLSRSSGADRLLERLDVAATAGGSVTEQAQVVFSRRADGALERVARPHGGDHEYTYDALGRLVEGRERAFGAWHATTHEWDAAGRATAVELPNGMRRETDYDGHGSVNARRTLRDGVLENEVLLARAAGRVVSSTDTSRGGAELYAYDAADRIVGVVYPGGESVALEYDLRSRRVAEIYSLPGEAPFLRVDYQYDLADRLVRGESDGVLLVELEYAAGQLAAERFGNGLERIYAYDPLTGLQTGSEMRDAGGAIVESATLERVVEVDPGRLVVKAETQTALALVKEHYSFGLGGSLVDPDRLVGRRVWHWTDDDGTSEAYAYDTLGNADAASPSEDFVYNAERNRLLSAKPEPGGPSHSYAYDAAGFVTARDGVALAWNADGRLVSHGGDSFEWDGLGRPVARTVSGATRDYSRFGGRIEVDSATGAPASVDLAGVRLDLATGERLYRHDDFRGNVRLTTDDSGVVRSHYRYAAYGLDGVFGAQDDDVRFARRSEAGELALLGVRVYDPAVGRFLSPDPVFQARNQYGYTDGDPVHYWDPDGAEGTLAAKGIALAQLTVSAALVGATIGTPYHAIAVAQFVVHAIEAAVEFGWIDEEDVARVEDLLRKFLSRIPFIPPIGVPIVDVPRLGSNLGGGGCRSKCGPGLRESVPHIGGPLGFGLSGLSFSFGGLTF